LFVDVFGWGSSDHIFVEAKGTDGFNKEGEFLLGGD
jgi:hypothetical protein